MVADMRSMRSLFIVELTRLSSKESKAVMLIGDMGITRLMIHVQQHKQKRPSPSSTSAPHQRTNVRTIVKILRTSELDMRIRKVVRHGGVLRLLHVLCVVGSTQLLHQIELHLDELLQGQAEKETVFMLSLVAESKRIRQMLSLV
ncbi:hypothetical protein MTR67_008035 [Solanum verrucosum]|uniref:Uncharacterized protein n=1 Tax=Solanum verrucosum TaxID=315347 RepID=A0AAF0TIU3_SOLVR|nr:hypothetical protein MTR67_008035 [Solanum verrucosum]